MRQSIITLVELIGKSRQIAYDRWERGKDTDEEFGLKLQALSLELEEIRVLASLSDPGERKYSCNDRCWKVFR